ncbi:transglycosylase SLT domain-containing protein [candidate division WWE3 bacterium]|nr:transglycosylase SLT domain-containing protein [candidate division WWE3 bacterium]
MNAELDYLKNRQKLLVELLKAKHKDFYLWMVENNIDPTDLKAYFSAIAIAVVVLFASYITPISNARGINRPEKLAPMSIETKIIQVGELMGKSEEEKGELVYKRYGHIIDRVAKKYKLDPKLIFATIMIESGGNTYALRYEPHINDSSYGLGQILFRTARWIGFEGQKEDLYDPEVNIDLIGRYYVKNKAMFGEDLSNEQLVTAYNAGSPFSNPTHGHVQKFQKWFNKAGEFLG